MPVTNLDIKSVQTFLAGLKTKLADLGRHL